MKFVVNITPVPKQSGTIKKGKARKSISNMIKPKSSLYLGKSPKVKSFETEFAYKIMAQRKKMFKGMLRLKNITYVFAIPKIQQKYYDECISAGRLPYKSSTPDLTDNLQKGWVDACKGILWKDDAAIVEMSGYVRKIFGTTPRIEFEVEEISTTPLKDGACKGSS